MSAAAKLGSKTLGALVDFGLWPALMAGACTGLAWGIAHGRGPLAFNIVYLLLAAALFWLERRRPHETEWLDSDGQVGPDLAHTLFTKITVQVTVVALANFGIVQQLGARDGSAWWPEVAPVFVQVGLGLVLVEFGLYWAHRIAHEWLPLWRFHAVHHSSKKLWFFNTGRFHIIDTLKSMIFSAPLLALAGAPKDVVLWFGAITAYIGFLTHANIQMRFGWLNYIFNTPGLHRWHHSMDLREGNKNYGENLMLWDIIFGTYYDDATRRPPVEIGINAAMPKHFWGQIVEPFRWNKFQNAAKKGEVKHKLL
jgi:sterol desaturase/sphingolipid hydroxylase (fatty acid hydroxylase superfamily)